MRGLRRMLHPRPTSPQCVLDVSALMPMLNAALCSLGTDVVARRPDCRDSMG